MLCVWYYWCSGNSEFNKLTPSQIGVKKFCNMVSCYPLTNMYTFTTYFSYYLSFKMFPTSSKVESYLILSYLVQIVKMCFCIF